MIDWQRVVWLVGFIGAAVSAGVYFRVVLPTLRVKGMIPSSPGRPSGDAWRHVEQYRRICEQEGNPLGAYRAMIWGQVVAASAGVVWIVLMLTRANE